MTIRKPIIYCKIWLLYPLTVNFNISDIFLIKIYLADIVK